MKGSRFDFKKTGSQMSPRLLPRLPPPLGVKNCLGGFLHQSQLKFEEILPKVPRMQILRKLAPLAVPPDYMLPWPTGGGFWHLSKLKFEGIPTNIPRM